MSTPSPIPTPATATPKTGWNTPSLVLGGLGLVAIGALGTMLLTGPRNTPAPAEPVAVAASQPALPAEPVTPPLAAVAVTPSPVAERAPAAPAPVATPPAHRTAAKPHAPTTVATTAPVSPPAEPPPVTPAQPAVDNAPTPGVRAEAAPPPAPVKAVCTSCGVVTAVTPIEQKGEGSGLGAIAGGVLGGVLGHQMGGGRGKDVMTVIGAVGGGVAGNEVEKRQRSTTSYQMSIKMDDGTRRTVTRDSAIGVGQRVRFEGEQLVLDNGAPR